MKICPYRFNLPKFELAGEWSLLKRGSGVTTLPIEDKHLRIKV